MNEPKAPKISIIFVNYNAAGIFKECLASIKNNVKGVSYEIIAVDDVSTDNSVEMIRSGFPDVRLVVNEKTLWSTPSQNNAIRMSKGEYLLFLGTDTVVYQNSVEKMADFLDKNKDAGAVTSKVFFPNGDFQQNACRDQSLKLGVLNYTFLGKIFPGAKRKANDHYTYKGWSWDENHEIDATGLTNMMMRKSIIEHIGYLDENMNYFVENDLCYRIRSDGNKIFYLAEGRIDHHLRGSVSKSNMSTIIRLFEHDFYQFFKKYYGPSAAFLLKILVSITNIMISVKNRRRDSIFASFLSKPKNA